MKLIKPTLELNELIVIKDKDTILNITFKKGLNVISGENSSGKTTILDLIAYNLGMEGVPLKIEALSCDFCYLGLKINGKNLTLRREISETPKRPISIIYEKLNLQNLDFYDWKTFPINRSDKVSYSQVMLTLLDNNLDVNVDSSASLTMHQIMRSIYASQPALHFPILTPTIFDDKLTRETIGKYILGFYSNDIYTMQIDLKRKSKEKVKISTELNFLKNIFQKSFFSFNDKNSAEKRIIKNNSTIKKLRQSLQDLNMQPKKIEKDNIKRIDSMRKKLNTLTNQKSNLESEKNKININALDSEIFINELKDRLIRLDESNYIQSISSISFEFCPSCLSPITNLSNSCCSLCKSEIESDGSSPLLRMKNELLIQIEESNKINQLRENKIKKIDLDISNINSEIKILSEQLIELTQHWSDNEKSLISNISFEIGTLENENKEISKLLPLYEEQFLLKEKLDSIEKKIDELESELEIKENESYALQESTIKKLNSNLISLLKQDIPREEEFINPKNVNISFTDNQIYINNKNKFSESSTVILRHLFHLALLKTADELEHMRFPRIVILDGIDDGGLEPERIMNLQEIILNTVRSLKNCHQVIIATSTKNLNNNLTPFIYNNLFTSQKKSLNFN